MIECGHVYGGRTPPPPEANWMVRFIGGPGLKSLECVVYFESRDAAEVYIYKVLRKQFRGRKLHAHLFEVQRGRSVQFVMHKRYNTSEVKEDWDDS